MKLFSFLSFVLSTFAMNAQVVNTQFGPVQGSASGNVIQFLGIPFAKPPVGDLRWKAPENPTPWTNPLTTTAFAPVCPQKQYDQTSTNYTLEGNEDCLYLNIWTPQTGSGTRPVMVFIHGGGNQQGGASLTSAGTQMYVGKNMAQRGDAVIVTIQYRLGPLGFLVHPGLESETTYGKSGNYAVMDQVLALNWVKNNIASFGGDPANVTIFGESAGGVNVGNLMTSPLAAGLFHRAIIQSACPNISVYSTSLTDGTNFVTNYTTSGTDIEKIAYMRSLPSDSLLHYENSPIIGGAVQMNWMSTIDNHVFTANPITKIQSGNFNNVPLLIGSNKDEMSLSVPLTVTPNMVTNLINTSVPAANQAQANTLYPAGTTTAESRDSYVGLLTDSQFTTTVRRTAECVSQNQVEPVYRYFFTHKHTVPQLSPYGSYHGMELFYVFNTWENATLGSGSFHHVEDDSVQNVMLKYWVNFARTGNPNGSGIANWPEFQTGADCYMEIKATPNGTQCGLRTEKSYFWDNVVHFNGCTSTNGIEENTFENANFIFPNPSNGIFNLELENETGNYEVFVFNALGNEIARKSNAKQIDLSQQKNGIYFFEVRFSNKILKAKVSKAE